WKSPLDPLLALYACGLRELSHVATATSAGSLAPHRAAAQWMAVSGAHSSTAQVEVGATGTGGGERRGATRSRRRDRRPASAAGGCRPVALQTQARSAFSIPVGCQRKHSGWCVNLFTAAGCGKPADPSD